eukprot:scaffold77415_cov28-Phaeocystis_antarctica.AAC.2
MLTCEVTKVARPRPITPRHTMKPAADSTQSMPGEGKRWGGGTRWGEGKRRGGVPATGPAMGSGSAQGLGSGLAPERAECGGADDEALTNLLAY